MTLAARIAGAAIALLIAFPAAGPAAADAPVPVVTGLGHGLHEGRLRLIFEVTPAPAHAVFTLKDPDRLVLDFPALDWQAPAADHGIPYLGRIRFGLFRQDRARVVIELTEPLGVDRVFTQAPSGGEPGRLVIDLSPVSRAAYDARAGLPEQARWRGEAPPMPPEARKGDLIIALDPGHGGIDPGAQVDGLTEKTLVLDFARALAAELDARPGITAYLVRDADVFVPLAERVARAHRAGANVLISIHADMVAVGRASGMSVYTLSEKGTDDAAEALAARENRADVIAGADLGGESDELTRLLVELAQRGTMDESGKLAVAMIESLGDRVELLRTRPYRQANFRVLKAPDIPSVLLELGFLNSARDRKRLTDPAWRAKAARAVADGIDRWRATASPGFLLPR